MLSENQNDNNFYGLDEYYQDNRRRKSSGPKIVLVVISIIIIAILLYRCIPPPSHQLGVRVIAEANQNPVEGASVILFLGDHYLNALSDSNGFVRFEIDSPLESNAHLIVETNYYQIHSQSIQLSSVNSDIIVSLKERDLIIGNIIVRTVDADERQSIVGAQIVLLIDGKTYSGITDNNGIALFEEIAFPPTGNGEINAQINVEKDGFVVNNQSVTLMANSIQNVQLVPSENAANITDRYLEPTDPERLTNLPTPTSTPTSRSTSTPTATSTSLPIDTSTLTPTPTNTPQQEIVGTWVCIESCDVTLSNPVIDIPDLEITMTWETIEFFEDGFYQTFATIGSLTNGQSGSYMLIDETRLQFIPEGESESRVRFAISDDKSQLSLRPNPSEPWILFQRE